jgi:murein DD-endopeptidase MepM/ murein hydrolase activator NlpD
MVLALVLASPARPAGAQVPLTLDGKPTQGALIVGKTAPGSKVRLDDKEIKVDDSGAFAFGLAHDAKPNATLVVTAPDGKSESRRLEVTQRQYAVQRIDGVPKRYVEPPPEVMKRLEEEYHLVRRARETESRLPFFRTGFIWPAAGRVSGVYGSQRIVNGKPLRPHFGVDVAAPTGTPVHAAAAGNVTLAHQDLYFSGKTVIIDHGLGVSTVYIHMNEIAVATGDTVRQGQKIGTIGSTGRSTGPHLHWGLNWHQDYLDPATVVGPMPGSGDAKKARPR